MAEYWKSTPKYWCKHCKTYVRDTGFDKAQHEATGKHQGSLKRFLRDVHRNQDREEKEGQRAKSEVERLKGLVSGSGSSSPSVLGGAESKSSRKPFAPGGDGGGRGERSEAQKRQVAQLAEMGVSIPEEFRPEMAMAGEWQVVSEKPVGERGETVKVKGVRKRKMPDEDEDEDEEEGGGEEGGRDTGDNAPRKPWGSTFRTYPGSGDGGEDDEELDMLLGKSISLKREKRPKIEDAVEGTVKREDIGSPVVDREVKQEDGEETKPVIPPEEDSAQEPDQSVTASSLPGVKSEGQPETESKVNLADIPAEPETAASTVVFKKRKPKQKR